MPQRNASESPGSLSPIHSSMKLTWRVKERYYTRDGIKITIRKTKEDPKAVLYCLKTPDGKRFLLQRTSCEMILVSSDARNDSTRFIACELK